MSLADRRRQRDADRRSGPLDQESAADLHILTIWHGALAIPMGALQGIPGLVDDAGLVDPYDAGVHIYVMNMALHSLDRLAAMKATAETAVDEPFEAIGLVSGHGLSQDELLARFEAAAEAAAIPSCVPDADVGLTDIVVWTWVVIDDLIDRITTYLRPLTEFEWEDFAKLCALVLELAPIAAASTGSEQPTPSSPGTVDRAPDSSC